MLILKKIIRGIRKILIGFMNIEIFICVTSLWADSIVNRICSCVTIFKTCNSPITIVFWNLSSKSFMYSRRQKIVIRTLFEDDVMVAVVNAMVLTWYFCLFFGKCQNDLIFSAAFNFYRNLVQGIIVILNHLGVISSEVDGIWWHQKFIFNISFKRSFKGGQNVTKKTIIRKSVLSSYFYFNFLKSVGKWTVLFNQWEKSLPFLFLIFFFFFFFWNTLKKSISIFLPMKKVKYLLSKKNYAKYLNLVTQSLEIA